MIKLHFVVCQVGDSTSLNTKIANDLGYPHVGCHDHCMNTGGKEMEKDTPDISALVNSIHDVQLSFKFQSEFRRILNSVRNYCQPDQNHVPVF